MQEIYIDDLFGKKWLTNLQEWGAWYSGDPQTLLNHYSTRFEETTDGRFIKKLEKQRRAQIVHMPLAGDIAATSGNLLFSEPADYEYDHKTGSGKRIQAFIEDNGLQSKLLESAELGAALGGVYLKLDVDPDVSPVPIVSTRTPLQSIPLFRSGRLYGVRFFRVVKTSKNTVWRLFEERQNTGGTLLITYRLYKGSSDRMGIEVGLDSISETENLRLENKTYRMPGLGAVYIPNMLPNRMYPGSPEGISDYAGVITMLDSLDEAWTSWMRDIRLGVARIFVDQEYMEDQSGNSLINQFDVLGEAFAKLNMSRDQISGNGYEPIHETQFDIRYDEHAKTVGDLIKQIVSMCGYSPHTFGMEQSGTAESGTALARRERKSMMTRQKKSRYWQLAIRRLFSQMQYIDKNSKLSTGYEPQDVSVTLQDSIVPDPKETSETIRNLDQARAASTYVKVKLANPDWTDDQVKEEVGRINKEQGLEPVPPDQIGG